MQPFMFVCTHIHNSLGRSTGTYVYNSYDPLSDGTYFYRGILDPHIHGDSTHVLHIHMHRVFEILYCMWVALSEHW